MRHPPSTLYASALRGSPRAAAPGAIEWEELPSLVSRVRSIGRALQEAESGSAGNLATHSTSVWDATCPAALDGTPNGAPTPFREPVDGVAVREVTEPDIFRHFFGR